MKPGTWCIAVYASFVAMVAAASELTADTKEATTFTRAANAAVKAQLPFDDDGDFELAAHNRLAGPADVKIVGESGQTVWDSTLYSFEEGEAPDTVNPSLWRQAKLNRIHGLFEVADGIYQVRGYDISNVTFVRGKTGWIVIDPLIAVEAARAAMDLVNATLGSRPVRAVIYSHSHADHFGGVKGVTTEEDVRAGRVTVIAPDGFLDYAVSENVLAGNAMTRRAMYMYGRLLPPGARGRVDSGLGKQTSTGRSSLIAPTEVIPATGGRRVVDGVTIEFRNTPGAEAPAEMIFYFPAQRALCVAEEANATLHNLYTLRGAEVRNGKLWARWLDEAIAEFGEELDVVFGSHHWPRFGRVDAVAYLEKQRDLYRFIHDQSLRLANQGYTPGEIAETLVLPASIGKEWFNRDYYGTVRHNARATYQLYLGWFDGNPASLNPLPPVEAAERYVEAMGGSASVIAKGREAYGRGDYRWVAEMLKHLVFAEPSNVEARYLAADAFEQLGYQAESGPWRNFYLTGALELRHGVAATRAGGNLGGELTSALTSEMLFDFLAVRLNPEKAKQPLHLELVFDDRDEQWLIDTTNAVLHYSAKRTSDTPSVRTAGGAAARLTLSRSDFVGVLSGQAQLAELIADKRASIEGESAAFAAFAGMFDRFDPWFEIVRP